MSNSLAIAAVTATLRNLLDTRINASPAVDPSSDPLLAGTEVTARPLDEAANQNFARQVNLFLYQVSPHAAWRNQDMPRQIRPGETGQPPLPLILHYLLTAYVRDNEEDAAFIGHRLLGRAMSILHDHALLGQAEIQNALTGNDLHTQVERVRLTLQPFALDEMSKLWTAFQTQYRLSAAYEASVVLIESNRPARTPLPVLRRGEEDRGVTSQPDLIPPYPTLTAVAFPNKQPSVRLNETLTLTGHHLDGTAITILFRHPLLTDPVTAPPEAGNTATGLQVVTPNQPDDLPAGIYTVAVQLTRPDETFSRTSNELPFALSPQLTVPTAVRNGNEITLTITANPTVRPEQRVALLLGPHEIPAQPHPTATNNLTFVAVDDPPGKFPTGAEFFTRLRVDGVDSLLIDYQAQPPQFDQNQKVALP
ncbi:MAG TPA: DUF4255 domain-containing protein [Chloroflexota bacterium]|nr:DUF4255 domain-containing protein [Chloroflexota bacterium]